jgi:two-component system, chemotaxis family, chemotaxis protein CheY
MPDIASAAVLVVDDSSTMRRILKTTLMKLGAVVVDEAGDGAEALAKSKLKQYDCVLTDWNMPVMDGLEFVVSLRKEPNYAKVPIIMVTTEGGKTDVVEALMKGVNDYIVKPFTQEIVQEKLAKLLK